MFYDILTMKALSIPFRISLPARYMSGIRRSFLRTDTSHRRSIREAAPYGCLLFPSVGRSLPDAP